MDAMAAEIERRGGQVTLGARVLRIGVAGHRVTGVDVDTANGRIALTAPAVVAGLPPAMVARLVEPAPPPELVPDLPPRAAVVVAVAVDRDRVTDEPWIQIDDPDVPFARMYEVKNWSARLVPAGRTVLDRKSVV